MKLQRPTTAPPLYSQDGKGYDAVVHEHYFIGGSDWLVTEYDPENGIAFGWACMNGDRQNAELGYVGLDELEAVAIPIRLRMKRQGQTDYVAAGEQSVERDEYWPEGLTLTEAIARLDRTR